MYLSEPSDLEFLDLVPERLYQRIITHKYKSLHYNKKHSRLQQRVHGVLAIRKCLLLGCPIPYEILLTWIDKNIFEKIIQPVNKANILKNTLNNESYTDEIILNILSWLDDAYESSAHGVKNIPHSQSNQWYQLTETNRSERTLTHLNHDKPYSSDNLKVELLPEYIDKSMQAIGKRFMIEQYLGWDFSKGIETLTDKQALIQTHQLIKKSKKIRNIIQLIGRNKASKFELQEVFGLNEIDLNDNAKALPDEHAINSVTGVCYSNDISRMLPLEMSFLSNQKLRKLWYSKFVEHKLLSYHFKGVMSEHSPSISHTSVNFELKKNHAIKTNGPIILCIDTSASMKGRPEQLAKAIALETMRIANIEKRACYLFCFSGPDEILELELDVTQGWKPIIEFLRLSFHGGTNIDNVLQHALNLQAEHKWKNADILVLSDGRVYICDELLTRISGLHERLRIYGLQLGQWNLNAFNQICHHTFNLADA